MTTAYQEFCAQNKENLTFQLMRCINDKTLHESYFIETNVLCDGINYYVSPTTVPVRYKRRDFRRRVAMLKNLFGHPPRLVATNNDLGYTRLIYRFSGKP